MVLLTLNKMGANISIYNSESKLGEDVGDIRVKYNGRLKNIKVDDMIVRDMIDEIPLPSIVAASFKRSYDYKWDFRTKIKGK